MPPPAPKSKSAHFHSAKSRLKREVIHRLASGSKTHSEMAEVHHVLCQRDNLILCETGKLVNPDDASGAALEDALSEVAVRKCRSGAPDEWELKAEAWEMYDPSFRHISTRAHQSAQEMRPVPGKAKPSSLVAGSKGVSDSSSATSRPYAPRPAIAHSAFSMIRKDFTADSCLLAVAYRVLHVHCHHQWDEKEQTEYSFPREGAAMYDKGIESETVLARAVHYLTLGAYAWEGLADTTQSENSYLPSQWRETGGGDVGSVFYNQFSSPTACDWVNMALLREPSEIMNAEWYRGKDTTLILLNKIASKGGKNHSGFLGNIDPSLKSGAAWLCNFASKFNPEATAQLLGEVSA